MNTSVDTKVEAKQRAKRKRRVGVVISAAMQKTIIVRTERRVRHPLYGKEMRLHAKFYAHDESGAARVGDRVEIMETRPLSRLKRWRLVKVLSQAERAPVTEEKQQA